MIDRSLVIFARAPALGQVKTRLAAEVGSERALAIYSALGRRILDAVRPAADCEIVIAFTPPDALDAVALWLAGADRYEAQGSGDLGARMDEAIARRLAAGARQVIVIGTDCPAVDAQMIERAFAKLDRADLVLGPAADGGYYLIGVSARQPGLFVDVPWSAPTTLQVTLDRARELSLEIALLEEQHDIDTAADWDRWVASSGA